VPTEISAHGRLEVAKQRHRLGSNFEYEPMLDQRGIRPVVRAIPRPSRGHAFLNLMGASIPRPRDPSPLGLSGRNSGELADRRPAELAGGEGIIEQGELGEGATDAEPLFRLSAVQPSHAFGILAKTRIASPRMHREALGSEEPTAKLALVSCTVLAEQYQVLVYAGPIGSSLRPSLARRQRVAFRFQGWSDILPNEQ
jgi:hypothetical protein